MEMRKVLDQLEDEHHRSLDKYYDYIDIHQFLSVYEAISRFLAEKGNGSEELSVSELESAFPHLPFNENMCCWDLLRDPKNIYYQKLDDAYDALEALHIDAKFDNMDHGWRTLCEARVAAITTYRQHMANPLLKYGVGEVRRTRVDETGSPISLKSG